MTAISTELSEAFREIGARLDKIARDVAVLKWMVGLVVTMAATLLLRSFTH